MKKVLLVVFVAALSLGSCKKEETAQPAKTVKIDAGDHQTTEGWD